MLRGRDDELARCAGVFDRVAAGGGGAVVVEGEAGMGKTTFVGAALERAADRGFAVLHGRGHALGAGVAYGPLATALGRYLHALAGDDRARLTAGLDSLARLVEGIGEAPPSGDPDLERSRLYQAVALLLGRVSADRPVVLCIDDLHWADAASVELLVYLTGELASEQVAMIVALRPGDVAGRPDVRHLLTALQRLPVTARIDVGPLVGADLAALVEDRLGGSPSPELLVEITERTGGVALAVDAVLRSLVDAEALTAGSGGWRAAEPLVVPEYVVELFAERIRSLSDNERSVVTAIGVADEPLDVDTLAAVTDIEFDDVAVAAGDVAVAGLAREVQPGHWDVNHPLVAEAANGALAEGERRRLHHAFARRLASGGDAVLDRYARHVVGAGSLLANDLAADVLGRAGRRALSRGATDVAARWLSAAAVRATSAGLPPKEIGELLVAAAGAWERRFELEAAVGAYGQAVDLLAIADPAAASLTAVTAARVSWLLGRASIDTWWARALELAESVSPGERLRVHYELLGAMLRQGRVAEAEDAAALLEADLASAPGGAEADAARFRLLAQKVFLGVAPAQRLVDEAPVLPRETPTDLIVNVEGPVLDSLVLLGRWSEAQRRATALLDVVGPDVTLSGLSWRAVTARVHSAVATGAWAEASDMLTELTGDAAVIRASRVFWLGVLATLRGELDEARAVVAEIRATIEPGVLRPHAGALLVVAAYVEHVAGTAPVGVDLGDRVPYNAMNHVLVCALAGEVLAAHGQHDEVARMAADLRGRAPSELPAAVADRLEALVAGDAAALLRVADAFDQLGMPFESARARLESYERDGGDHRRDLVAVIDVLQGLGAEPWAARARALAGHPVAPSRPAHEQLTPRERQIALLVTEGLTNGQIAERLAISIRTVTSHLDHAYTKLGINSRAALVSYVLREPAAPAAPTT